MMVVQYESEYITKRYKRAGECTWYLIMFAGNDWKYLHGWIAVFERACVVAMSNADERRRVRRRKWRLSAHNPAGVDQLFPQIVRLSLVRCR